MRYVAGRLLQSVLTLFMFMVVIFVATRAAGDPATLLMPVDASPDEIAAARKRFGTDKPYSEQFLIFLEDLLTFDLGRSVVHKEPVGDLVGGRVLASLSLAASSLALVMVTAVPLGVLAATRRGRTADRVVRAVAAFGQAAPGFWVGLMLIQVFAVLLGLLPAGGVGGAESLSWEFYILPSVTLALPLFAGLTRLLRSSMLENLDAEFVKLARAKGVPEAGVIWLHVLRNALLPLITLMALWVGTAVAGSVVTETVFNWPGIGALFLQSVLARDFPVIQAVVALLGATVMLANLAADLLYAVVDPRIRVETGRRGQA
ncbi:MAG TPA: ABC transporter permease [Chloroflexota bacterium]|jgi:peptide/nickel transport system permease protein|nr:ABC transporter permease [Chloroflexota bacterium]